MIKEGGIIRSLSFCRCAGHVPKHRRKFPVLPVSPERRTLTNAIIDEWTSKANKIYEEALPKKKKSTPIVSLGIEEMLLRFRDNYGTDPPSGRPKTLIFRGLDAIFSNKNARYFYLTPTTE